MGLGLCLGQALGAGEVVLPNCRELVNTGGHGCGDAGPAPFGCAYKYGSGAGCAVCIDFRREDGCLLVSDGLVGV